MIETIHQVKKDVIKAYRDYLTVEGQYTSLLPDSIYIKKLYKKKLGRTLDLRHPKTFSEKQNWLKLHDRKAEYHVMVDKFAARSYVASKIGEEYLVPLLGVWDSVEEIDFDRLPEQFVLKCNHDNGVVVCTDKQHFDVEDAKKQLKYHLGRDYYKKCREWPYKGLKRKIICEKFMQNHDDTPLVDYRLLCFNGVPKLLMLYSERYSETGVKCDIFDMDWNHTGIHSSNHPMAGDHFQKPANFDKMVELSKILSKEIPFVRVDFNEWDGKIYFGELTFYHIAGFVLFQPDEWNRKIGDWIVLPK